MAPRLDPLDAPLQAPVQAPLQAPVHAPVHAPGRALAQPPVHQPVGALVAQRHDPPGDSDDPIADAHAVLRWAADSFGDGLCVTASFSDATLAHVVQSAVPGIQITLLDTGYLFAETEWFADHLRDRYDLDLRIIRPAPDLERDRWRTDTDACCQARKVEPLERALAGQAAWVTGLRRSDSPSRRSTPLVHDDLLRGVVKVNPLAGWSDEVVAAYAATHGLPEHPLADRNYSSIGCWPCTRPATDPDDPRSGRWAGSEKTECGLHLTASTMPVEVTSP